MNKQESYTMTTPFPDEERQPRDTAYWAEEASVFKVERAPTGALNLQQTLINLVAHFSISAPVQLTATCIDKHMQWSQAGNVWQNAAIRTAIYTMLSPLR